MSTQDTTGKNFMREADARILIDRKLREASWDIEDKNQVSTEEPAQTGRADYLLKDSRGRAIAVVEAKRFSVDPASAKQQALSYAESINADFIFLSNGEEIYFWDYKNRPEQKVATFYSQRDLEKIQSLRLEQKPISVIPIPEKYFKGGEWRALRPYQKEAMQIMDKALMGGKRKMLLVMATGTGKTDTIALYLKRLFEAGIVNRALFLVDRIDLGVQTKEVFDEILKDYPSKLLYGGKQRDESSIIISTLPTLYSQLSLFTSGYFDVIVSDEAHRSIFGIYNAVLSHFDAIRIGLTATPSAYVDRNTYKLFGCWDETEQKGKPTFVYSIRSGIKDGYLAGYDIVQIDTKVSLEGVQYEGEDYNPEDLERKINVPARNEQIVQSYFAEEEKRQPNKQRKAIVYAVTKRHASQLAYYFNQAKPEYKGRFAEIITSDTEDPRGAIRRFKLEELPMIAVSVGMMDTGIDAPMVENLIMVRPTRSPILYQQMRGRGSRLDPRINKKSFRIYDFAGVTKYFNDESYNPYSEIAKAKAGVPWGTEVKDFEEENLEVPAGFIQVAETAPENVDVVVKRAYVEVGPQGEKIDSDDYQVAWERQIQELAKAEPLIKKVKECQELSSDESMVLAEKLNSPKYYFNEANLREAYQYPPGTLNEFIKTALGIQQLPTEKQLYEERINELFEAWLIDKQFTVEQAKILRLIKAQFVARRQPIDATIFEEPMFRALGGLNRVLQMFGEDKLKSTLKELNQSVFVNS
ncbi:MAG TPA: DEAD/DEAH box helicase family protein [Candidatus Paceibacterota bacterium]|nr:DEAD/DEAH box helicase family protein [Candidatus Paceibacterota bacterium]